MVLVLWLLSVNNVFLCAVTAAKIWICFLDYPWRNSGRRWWNSPKKGLWGERLSSGQCYQLLHSPKPRKPCLTKTLEGVFLWAPHSPFAARTIDLFSEIVILVISGRRKTYLHHLFAHTNLSLIISTVKRNEGREVKILILVIISSLLNTWLFIGAISMDEPIPKLDSIY